LTVFLMGAVNIVLSNIRRQSWDFNNLQHNSSPLKSEFLLVGLIIGANTLLAHNTITILATAPIALLLRDKAGISPLRATQLIDLSANTVMHILPYMITVIIAIALARADLNLYGIDRLNPISVGISNFHSIALALVLFVVISTGTFRNTKNNKK